MIRSSANCRMNVEVVLEAIKYFTIGGQMCYQLQNFKFSDSLAYLSDLRSIHIIAVKQEPSFNAEHLQYSWYTNV